MSRCVPIALCLLGSCALLPASGCNSEGESKKAEPGTDEDEAESRSKETAHGLTEEQAQKPLVEVGDTTITVGEFADRLAGQSPYLRARYDSPRRRKEFLDNMVKFELLAAEAKRRGLDELPAVQRTVKQKMIQQLTKDLVEEGVDLSDITDEEIRTYYNEHKEEFYKPEQVRGSHILFRNPKNAHRVLRKLQRNEGDAQLFREMASKYSRDRETRNRDGDLRFFSKPSEQNGGSGNGASVPDPVAEAAFELDEIGDIYPELVRSRRGWHIVKLTGQREALQRSLEQARRPIQNRLWRKKRQKIVDELIQELRKEADIEENLDALKDVEIETGETGQSPSNNETGKESGSAAGDGGAAAKKGTKTESGEHAEEAGR